MSANWHLSKLGFYPLTGPLRKGGQSPLSGVGWVNSFGSLELLQIGIQAGTESSQGSGLRWPEAMLKFIAEVCMPSFLPRIFAVLSNKNKDFSEALCSWNTENIIRDLTFWYSLLAL